MGKLCKCKTCGEEIASNAKVCPKCGAKQKRKTWIFVLAGFVIITTIAANFSGGTTSTSNTTSSTTEIHKIGETFKTKKFEITVNNVSKKGWVGDDLFFQESPEGAIYVRVLWEYKNITDEPISSFNLPSMVLVSPKGKEYRPDIGASSSFAAEQYIDEKVISDLNPGIKSRSGTVFEVSEELIKEDGWSLKIAGEKIAITL